MCKNVTKFTVIYFGKILHFLHFYSQKISYNLIYSLFIFMIKNKILFNLAFLSIEILYL